MRGRNWQGDDERFLDLRETLAPLVDVMRRQQEAIGVSGRDLSRKAGMDPSWLSGIFHTLHRPLVGRLAFFASQVKAQEFGLHLDFEDEGAAFAVYDMDVPAPWHFRESRKLGQRTQIVDLRQTLDPMRAMMQQRRRRRYVSVAEFIAQAELNITRNGVADLEGGNGLTSPGLARLTCWTSALGAESFGPYIVIDGEYTDVNLLEAL